MRSYRHPALVSLSVLLLMLLFGQLAPDFFLYALGYPSAWLASIWLGAPLLPDANGWVIGHSTLAIHVTAACNGAGFFALLVALAAGKLAGSSWRSRIKRTPFWLPALAAGAIVANSSRLIMAWGAALAVRAWATPRFEAAAHYAAGLIVFFVFLVLYHYLIERTPYEQTT